MATKAKIEKDPERKGCYLADGVPQVEGWEPESTKAPTKR